MGEMISGIVLFGLPAILWAFVFIAGKFWK